MMVGGTPLRSARLQALRRGRDKLARLYVSRLVLGAHRVYRPRVHATARRQRGHPEGIRLLGSIALHIYSSTYQAVGNDKSMSLHIYSEQYTDIYIAINIEIYI